MIKSGLRPTAQLRIATVLLRKTDRRDAPFAMYDDYVQHIKIMTAIWFEPVIENLKDEGLSQQIVSSLLLGAEWLSETNKILVEESIRMLFDKNYIAFMHIAIPTYESIFRRLFGFHDLATTHLDMKDGSQKVNTHPWVPQNKRNRHFQAIPIDLDLDI